MILAGERCLNERGRDKFPSTMIVPHEALKIELIKTGQAGNDVVYDILVDDIPAGYIDFNDIPADVHQIEIDTEYRGKGIGGFVYQFIESKYFQGKFIELEAYNSACGFWEKMGFKVKKVELYDTNDPEIPYLLIMTKQA
jgi:GNAT superfamily N-acetyltransferase